MITFTISVKCLVYWGRRRPRKSLTSICPTIDVCEVRNDREWRSGTGCAPLINQSEALMINTDQWEAFYEVLVCQAMFPQIGMFLWPGGWRVNSQWRAPSVCRAAILKILREVICIKICHTSHCYCHSDKLFLAVFHKNPRFESCRQHVHCT